MAEQSPQLTLLASTAPTSGTQNGIPIPEGFTTYQENNAKLLYPKSNTAFLNPVQEFNRDLSVSVIKEWTELRTEELKEKWEKGKDKAMAQKQKKRDRQLQNKEASTSNEAEPLTNASTSTSDPIIEAERPQPTFKQPKFTVLEALSATGLRSIRYAQELPNVGLVLANDFSPSACESMRRNVAYNDIGAIPTPSTEEDKNDGQAARGRKRKRYDRGGVVVNEGDAAALLYSHRPEPDRVDVIDLDPYGTAAPFIDGAVQSVSDGGMLCVTCTDLAVLAGTNYPEKCFSNYGGTPAKGEYTHEAALRLVLGSISTAAARYGRYIVPMLSLSIDFYVRLFVRVYTSQLHVKQLFVNHGSVYVCHYCQAFHAQPSGKSVQQVSAKGKENTVFKFATGPPAAVAREGGCEHCGSTFSLAGPMWLGPIHNPKFIDRVIHRLEDGGEKSLYKTAPRMKGMLAVARDELDTLFFYTPSRVASLFRGTCPSLPEFASALTTAGYAVSRSHCVAGSVKTNAPFQFVLDIMREQIKSKPVRKDKVSETSPCWKLLEKEQKHEVSLAITPIGKQFGVRKDLVRYQSNPTANWGPAVRAKVVRSSSNLATGDSGTGTGTGSETVGAKDEEEELVNVEVEENEEEALMNAMAVEASKEEASVGGSARGMKRDIDQVEKDGQGDEVEEGSKKAK